MTTRPTLCRVGWFDFEDHRWRYRWYADQDIAGRRYRELVENHERDHAEPVYGGELDCWAPTFDYWPQCPKGPTGLAIFLNDLCDEDD